MTDFTTLDVDDLGVDRIATSPTAYALYENLLAVLEGATGAPRMQTAGLQDLLITTAKIANANVTQGKLANSSVGQAQLKTSQGTMSSSGGAGALSKHVGPGGEYGFWPTLIYSGGGTFVSAVAPASAVDGAGATSIQTANTSYANIFMLACITVDVTAAQRYVTASPPYDLGDGEIPLFMFGLVHRTTGEIHHFWCAEDPPWANNGPTNIRPDFIVNGKGMQRFKRTQISRAEAVSEPEKMEDYIAQLREAKYELREVTQEIKNADIGLIPHPFIYMDLADYAVVMIDPMADLCGQMKELINDPQMDISKLFFGRKITIGNEPLQRVTPSGVIAVSPSWSRK